MIDEGTRNAVIGFVVGVIVGLVIWTFIAAIIIVRYLP